MRAIFECQDATRIRRGLLLPSLAFVLLAFLAASVLREIAIPLLAIGAIAAAYVWLSNPFPSDERGPVRATPEGVWFRGELLLRRDVILHGLVVSHPGHPTTVRLYLRGPRLPVEISLPYPAMGPELLRVLGLEVTQAVAEFKLPAHILAASEGRTLHLLLFICAGIVHVALPMPWWWFGVVFAIASLPHLLPSTRLRVGSDGLHLRWLAFERFIPYRQVRRLSQYTRPKGKRGRERGLKLWIGSSEKLLLPTSESSLFGAEVDVVEQRIREAMERHAGSEGLAVAAQLDRGARDVLRWIRDLRAMGSGASAGHRRAPVRPEDLWEVLGDPGTAPSVRAAAAVTLAASGEDRGRLQATAAGMAAPRLRVAIEAAAEGQDQALAEALAEITAEEEASAALPAARR